MAGVSEFFHKVSKSKKKKKIIFLGGEVVGVRGW